MIKKRMWLDLELRKDIDDYLTLLMALKRDDIELAYISIHNPSVSEISLLKNTILQNTNSYPTIVISGEITAYDDDIHKSLMNIASLTLDYKKIITLSLEELLSDKSIKLSELTYFTGGSLYTLSKIMEKESNVTAFIQGGYAGSNIIPNEIALKKFKSRDAVPSWNLNLDLDATLKVLSYSNANLHFISKNICHASLISEVDLKNKTGNAVEVLINYFGYTEDSRLKNKAMHDVLAFMSIFDVNLVSFERVTLTTLIKEGGYTKWKSEINNDSNVKISVNFDYDRFKKEFFRLID